MIDIIKCSVVHSFCDRPVMGNKNSPAPNPNPSGEAGPRVDRTRVSNPEPEPAVEPGVAMANPLGDKSAEYRVMRRCSDMLTRGINADDLTSALFSEGVISQADKDEASNYMMSKGRRAAMLVDAVTSAVEKDPDNFRKFIRILKREAAFARIAETLQGKRCGGIFV